MTDTKKDNILLSNLGLSRNDLDDSGDMLEELKDIMDLNSDLYKTESPNISYKKAVNNLKSKVRFK
jgi:hypothetical protein|tara:strand:- start:236 stop:433 length:198 start_codon:yes stop_codon:yes gene_type:complete